MRRTATTPDGPNVSPEGSQEATRDLDKVRSNVRKAIGDFMAKQREAQDEREALIARPRPWVKRKPSRR